MPHALRSTASILVGLLLVSLIVEGLEFGLVSVLNGGITTDPERYYAVRNRVWFLGLKLLYNGGSAVLAGYVAARIAGRREVAHGMALAAVQAVAFGWALTQPAIRRSTPAWAWVGLISFTVVGILVGSGLRVRAQGWARPASVVASRS